MPELFPTFDIPTIPENTSTPSTQELKKSFLFDFEKGEFVTNGTGEVQMCDGLTAWKQWCLKVVQTTRYAYLAYDGDIGIEDEKVRQQPDRKAAESTYTRTVTEALMVHPYTDSVRNFSFTWQGDNMEASFDVYSKEGTAFKTSTQLTT